MSKIYYVDSYNDDYEWSRELLMGILDILEVNRKDESTYLNLEDSLILKVFHMDTKQASEEKKKRKALIAKKEIEDWGPDVIIASDDNASKYLVSPYFRDSSVPVVFCGVNWSADQYGFPASNITGMIEVDNIAPLINRLKIYAKGERVGAIFPDNLTSNKQLDYYRNSSEIDLHEVTMAKSFSQWKEGYLELQEKTDLIILMNNSGVRDWNEEEALSLVMKNTKVPTGALYEWMAKYSMISYVKSSREHGEWSALTAMRILRGATPSDIPVVNSRKVANIYTNDELAKRIGVILNNDLIELEESRKEEGPYSYEKIDELDYRGRKLRILTHEIPIMGEPTELHGRQFELLTGIDVEVSQVPFNQLYQEALLGLKTNKYDVIFFGSLWLSDFYEYLEPVPSKMLNSPCFINISSHYKNIAKWKGETMQITIDGDRHYLQYRHDLLNSPEYRNEFLKEYGRPLRVPKTWKELKRIACFFNGKKVFNNRTVYGMAEITRKNDLLFSQFIKRAASYAKHPDVKDGFYFDLQTMKPLINTPGFVEALKDFVETTDYYPPNGMDFCLKDVIFSFGNGETVFADNWDDSFARAMRLGSPISGKTRASISPGSKKVWNRKTGKWDFFPQVNHVPYIAWGWTSAVAASSENKEEAFNFLGFFCNNENHYSDLQVGRFGINPYREEDLILDYWTEKAGWNKEAAKSYINTLKEMNFLKNKIMDLRILQGRQYMKALSVGVYRALTKRSSPKEALDEVAWRWEIITERVGREKQRKAYSEIVKFENGDL